MTAQAQWLPEVKAFLAQSPIQMFFLGQVIIYWRFW